MVTDQQVEKLLEQAIKFKLEEPIFQILSGFGIEVEKEGEGYRWRREGWQEKEA